MLLVFIGDFSPNYYIE